jgi:uncharacterized SAM-binding protein YcdF (DUF218 family)
MRLVAAIRYGLEGSAIGIAIWCSLFTLQVLPNKLADSPGLVLAAVIGLIAGATGRRAALLIALQIAAAAALLIAASPVSEWIAARWVRNEALTPEGVAAVVVLSAGLNPDTTISSEAADHLLMGLELVRAGKAHSLVTTTTEERFPTGFVSSEVDQGRLIDLLAPQVSWMRTPPGRSTRDEAVGSATLLLPRDIRDIAVIASPMHTRRACAAFEAVGFHVTCIASRLRGPGSQPVSPAASSRFAVFGQLVYEIAAIVDYSIHGWIHDSRIRA